MIINIVPEQVFLQHLWRCLEYAGVYLGQEFLPCYVLEKISSKLWVPLKEHNICLEYCFHPMTNPEETYPGVSLL